MDLKDNRLAYFVCFFFVVLTSILNIELSNSIFPVTIEYPFKTYKKELGPYPYILIQVVAVRAETFFLWIWVILFRGYGLL